MTEKDKKIQDLQKEVAELKKEKKYILSVIDKECIWDEHEWGYLNDFPKGKVRTLMMDLKVRKPLNLGSNDK